MKSSGEEAEPFHLSCVLARLLRAHARLRMCESPDYTGPEFLRDKAREYREELLDELLSLLPEEVFEGGRRAVTAECVLDGFRPEVMLDVCGSRLTKDVMEEVIRLAFGPPRSEGGNRRFLPGIPDDCVDEHEA